MFLRRSVYDDSCCRRTVLSVISLAVAVGLAAFAVGVRDKTNASL